MRIVDDRPAGHGYAAARRSMIDSQLRTSGVNARFVLERMLAVPREDFVPVEARAIAYIDRAVPLGPGPSGEPRFLAAPVLHGMMLQEAEPTLRDSALVVDGGSGYLPELLRPLVGALDVIDPAEAVRGPAVASGAGAAAGYSLLLIDGAVEQVPAALVERLAGDGRALTGLVQNGVTRLAAGRRVGADLALLPLAELGIPVLPAFAKPRAWTF